MSEDNSQELDKLVEQWKVKKLIKKLREAKGNGTSMISLIIPPKTQVAAIGKLLQEEQGTATNIKSRVNRLSVLSAIASARERLKLYNKIPNNGLVVYCGTVITEEGKEKNYHFILNLLNQLITNYICVITNFMLNHWQNY